MRAARLARALVVAGAAAVLAIASGAPAHAQAAQATLDVFMRDVTVPTAGPGVVERVTLIPSEPVEFDEITMTFDFSDIAGFATVAEHEPGGGRDCSLTSAAVLTCVDPFGFSLSGATSVPPDVVIAATGAAVEGDEGILRITVEAGDLAPATHEVRVRLGTGVNLAAGPSAEREAGVGESFTHAVSVTNVGGTAVDGVSLLLFGDRALRAGQTFENCIYAGDRPRACHFDQVLTPGVTYEAAIPYVVRPDTFAPSSQAVEFQWLTPAEFEDLAAQSARFGGDLGQPGTGAVLELAEAGTLASSSVQADVEPIDNWSSLLVGVTGENGTDLAAVGDTVTGGEGDQVGAVVGIRNNGPATIDRSRAGSAAARVYVTIPPGTTAVTVPVMCLPETEDGQQDFENPGQPGHRRYVCFTNSLVLPAGESVTFELTLRIDEVIPDAAGSVAILKPCACDDLPLEVDQDHSNNLAPILVNPTSTGPALPDTGSRVGPIAALGGLLLLLGTGVVVLALRRRLPSNR